MMPIFFPFKSAIRLNSGLAYEGKDLPVGRARNQSQVCSLQIGLRRVGAIHEGKCYFTCEYRLNTTRARRNMNQLDVSSVFLEQSFLVRHEHAALRAGYRRPVDAGPGSAPVPERARTQRHAEQE